MKTSDNLGLRDAGLQLAPNQKSKFEIQKFPEPPACSVATRICAGFIPF